jgi:hypothetical protein
MNEDRLPKKVLNMKAEGTFPRGRQISRWEQQVRKDVTQKQRTWEHTEQEELWEDRDRWRGLVVNDPHKMQTSEEEEEVILLGDGCCFISREH